MIARQPGPENGAQLARQLWVALMFVRQLAVWRLLSTHDSPLVAGHACLQALQASWRDIDDRARHIRALIEQPEVADFEGDSIDGTMLRMAQGLAHVAPEYLRQTGDSESSMVATLILLSAKISEIDGPLRAVAEAFLTSCGDIVDHAPGPEEQVSDHPFIPDASPPVRPECSQMAVISEAWPSLRDAPGNASMSSMCPGVHQ